MSCWYFGFAKRGKEFEVAAAIGKHCLCYCAKKMIFTRTGKKRHVKAITIPKLPNYLFLKLPVEVFYDVQTCSRYLYPTFSELTRNDVVDLMKFKQAVDSEYEASARRVANSAVDLEQFVAGQKLTELTGRFGQRCLTYHRMIQHAHDEYPKVQASMPMFGREVVVELDPLDVKAAE